MWLVWACFLVFLASPPWTLELWPLKTVDFGGLGLHPLASVGINLCLLAVFCVQHSLMARPWFKARVMGRLPQVFERCTYVHLANLALIALVLFWQPIPAIVWDAKSPLKDAIWVVFAAGWLILLLGALSFGLLELLGVQQMRAWVNGTTSSPLTLKTGFLYRVMPHPMYVGVLTAMWATPRMTLGHLLLATCMTIYVLVAVRYEERDLAARFGADYSRWRLT
jgi:methanethiol S-methyltransferase